MNNNNNNNAGIFSLGCVDGRPATAGLKGVPSDFCPVKHVSSHYICNWKRLTQNVGLLPAVEKLAFILCTKSG
jgi:hypothetical protein